MVLGTVKLWNDVEGWGLLTSPKVPGEVLAHFSQIAGEVETGYRALDEGDRVQFDWEYYTRPGQDSYFYRATYIVRLDGPEGGSGVREPRRPKPAGDAGAVPPAETDDGSA